MPDLLEPPAEPLGPRPDGIVCVQRIVAHWSTSANWNRLVHRLELRVWDWARELAQDGVQSVFAILQKELVLADPSVPPHRYFRYLARPQYADPENAAGKLVQFAHWELLLLLKKPPSPLPPEVPGQGEDPAETWPPSEGLYWDEIQERIGRTNSAILHLRYEGYSYREIHEKYGYGVSSGEVLRRLVGIFEDRHWSPACVANDVSEEDVMADAGAELERKGCAAKLLARSHDDFHLANRYLASALTTNRFWERLAGLLDPGFGKMDEADQDKRLGALRQSVFRLKKQVPCFGAWFRLGKG